MMLSLNFFLGLIILGALLLMTTTIFWGSKIQIKFSLIIILFTSFVLRVIPALDPLPHEWDERFHALVAKNMEKDLFRPTLYYNPVLEYNYQNWTSNHIWLHKQPIPLWIIHFAFKFFGTNTFIIRLPSVLMSILCVFFTFVICNILFRDEKISILASYLQGVNGFIIENSVGRIATDHVDCHFLFFTELSILFICLYREKPNRQVYLLVIGVALGIAILTKWVTALFVIPLFIILCFEKMIFIKIGLRTIFIAFIAFLVSLPWQLYVFKHFPLEARWEQNFNFRHIFETIEEHAGNWYYHISNARIIWNELIYLPFIWLLITIFRYPRKSEYWFLIAWIYIPYLFFSIVKTKMPGYVIICAPAIFIVAALFIQKMLLLKPKVGKFLLLAFVSLAIRYSIERIKPFRNDQESKNTFEVINRIKNYSDSENTLLFNFPHPIEAMFFTNWIVYAKLPSINELIDLKSKGYKVLVYSDGLSKEYIESKYIKIVK